MSQLGQDELAKYPFLVDTKQYLEEHGFTLEQLANDPDLKDIRERAFERIKVSTEGKMSVLDLTDEVKEHTLLYEIFSFLLAMISLNLAEKPILIKRFALAELRRAEKLLESDLGNIKNKSKRMLSMQIIYEITSMQIKEREGGFIVTIQDYERLSKKVHVHELKLDDKCIDKDQVFLNAHQIVILVREEIREYIQSNIAKTRTPQMIQGLESITADIIELAKKFENKAVYSNDDFSLNDPIKMLKSKENLKLGQDELAKYPFLANAGQYLRDKGFTLEHLANDPDLKDIRERAFERIKVSTEGKMFVSDLTDEASKEHMLPREVFSFLLAVILLKLSSKSTLVNRFALAEAQRAEKFLESDLGDNKSDSKRLAIKIIGDLFSVEIGERDNDFVVHIQDYIQHSIKFHEREWKLVNRRVEEGFVFLNKHQTVRLIRQKLTEHIKSKIIQANTPQMIQGLESITADIIELAKKFEGNVVYSGEYPPCIKHAIKVLEDGENLPHSGRFMLATFLLARGKSIQEIAPLFKNAPDYNEKITLYQLNNLAGSSGTKYTCPSCVKLNTQDLCFKIPECDKIYNPVQFGAKLE